MKAIINKVFMFFIGVLMIVSLSSCSGNDRVYTMDEIEGVYCYTEVSSSRTYDYYLVIEDNQGRAYKESYSFQGDRLGIPHDIDEMFSGEVILTDKKIIIGDYSGYIITDGKIKITINEYTYSKVK